MNTKKGSAFRANLYLFMGSLLLTFGLGELILRVTGLGAPSHILLFNDTIILGRPHARFLNVKENRNRVQLNNWGFHDYTRRADNQGYRILFLGDSMVAGLQVPVDSLFTARLEALFRREGAVVEVINGAMSDTGTTSQYLLWREFFKHTVRIDHVILCFFVRNDLENNHQRLGGAIKNYGAYVDSTGHVFVNKVDYSLVQSLGRKAASYSALVNMIYTRLYLLKRSILNAKYKEHRRSVGESIRQEGGAPLVVFETEWEEAVQGTLKLIERWHAELSQQGIGFSIVVIGGTQYHNTGTTGHPYRDQILHQLHAYAAEAEVPLHSLLFEGYTPYETNFFDGEQFGHFNYLGHHLAARRLHAWLQDILSDEEAPLSP